MALLQYLSRDKDYQSRHAYVDEFTPLPLQGHEYIFPYVPPRDGLASNVPGAPEDLASLEDALAKVAMTNVHEKSELLMRLASLDPLPGYRSKRNLAHHPKFNEGVRYMAELNQNEPACFVMLGLACIQAEDLNLAARAFERAIKLGSPQQSILEDRIAEIRKHIRDASVHAGSWWTVGIGFVIVAAFPYVVYRLTLRRMFARGAADSESKPARFDETARSDC